MTRPEMTLQTIADYAAFLEKMEATDENRQYMNRVYALLCDAKTGDQIEIDRITLPANLPKFIGCACLYIWETNKAEFSNDYKFIKKL